MCCVLVLRLFVCLLCVTLAFLSGLSGLVVLSALSHLSTLHTRHTHPTTNNHTNTTQVRQLLFPDPDQPVRAFRAENPDYERGIAVRCRVCDAAAAAVCCVSCCVAACFAGGAWRASLLNPEHPPFFVITNKKQTGGLEAQAAPLARV